MKRMRHIRRTQQEGFTLVWVTLGIAVIFGMAAYAMDVSYWYERQASAQRAADAAALGGALKLAYSFPVTTANSAAQSFAAANGYDPTSDAKVFFTPTPNYNGNQFLYHVHLGRNEKPVFSSIFGRNSAAVSASATAEFTSYVPEQYPPSFYGGLPSLPTDPQNQSSATTPYTYSEFGPLGEHQYGDMYSVNLLQNGKSNTLQRTQGLNFTIQMPSNRILTGINTSGQQYTTTMMAVEI